MGSARTFSVSAVSSSVYVLGAFMYEGRVGDNSVRREDPFNMLFTSSLIFCAVPFVVDRF